MPSAATIAKDLLEKRKAIAAEFESHKTKDGYDIPSDKVGEFRKRNEELNKLGKEWEEARDIEEMAAKNSKEIEDLGRPANRPPFPGPGQAAQGDARGQDGAAALTVGELYGKHGYNRDARGHFFLDVGGRPLAKMNVAIELPGGTSDGLKTTMTTSAGYAPQNIRSGKVQPYPTRPLMVADLLPTIPIGIGNAYVYMEETTFTNNSAEIAENDGTGAPENALAYTERTATARRVAAFLPVTDEQIADVAGMSALIDGRGALMVELRLDSQILNGDGIAPNINGFYAQVSQAQAKGADPVFDCIFKAMTKVMHTGFATPTGVVLHPNDWQDIRLTRTTDGIYILGNPGDVDTGRLFGVPVAVTSAALENTGLVGDFRMHAALVYRQGLEVEFSNSHSDYFKKFLQALRISLRAALVVFRASAFCECTGI